METTIIVISTIIIVAGAVVFWLIYRKGEL
jgi:hypothetical protein